jgi:hypothetical protein
MYWLWISILKTDLKYVFVEIKELAESNITERCMDGRNMLGYSKIKS